MKTARILFIIPSIGFIIIGLLHTQVHFSTLTSDALQQQIAPAGSFDLAGNPASIWKNWQGFSFLMGIGFIIVGLLNLSFMANIKKTEGPPAMSILVMILFFMAVAYSGALFFTSFQLYGGIACILILIASYIYSKRS